MAALEAALDVWAEVDIMAAAGDSLGLDCVSPRDPAARGSHIGFRHPHARELSQALIERGVIGDFRAPDVLRLGLTPLYLSYEDVRRADEILGELVREEAWRETRFATRFAIT